MGPEMAIYKTGWRQKDRHKHR